MKTTNYEVMFTPTMSRFIHAFSAREAVIVAQADMIKSGMDYSVLAVMNAETGEQEPTPTQP